MSRPHSYLCALQEDAETQSSLEVRESEEVERPCPLAARRRMAGKAKTAQRRCGMVMSFASE